MPRFASRRRRSALDLGANYGFLRPTRRHEEEQKRLLERTAGTPAMRREYRMSLIVQMVVVALLFAAMLALLVQSYLLVRKFHDPRLAPLGWMVPALAALLGVVIGRRFLRLLNDYRRLS
jgi:hypothetical protein